jgi:hypothetical protein
MNTYEDYTHCIRRLGDELISIFEKEIVLTEQSLVETQEKIVEIQNILKMANAHRSDTLELLQKSKDEIESLQQNMQNKEYTLINIKAMALAAISEIAPEVVESSLDNLKSILEELDNYDPEHRD